MQPRRSSNNSGTIVKLGLLSLLVIGGINYNGLADQYALATYKPTFELSGFESRVTLTPKARAALYRANPQFDAKAAFNTDCDTKPHELELGCYYRGRIYVLRIDNSSLAPEMDVVSAHELLHAAWSQLGGAERERLSGLLQAQYRSLNDKDLNERMAGYAVSEPGEEANELHSILATEYASLSPELETYYAKYFTQRSQVVAQHESYQNVFDSRRVELERELAKIRSQKATLSGINRQMDAYKSSGQISAYNALVPQQNRLVETINQQIEAYRAGVAEYNELSKSLDSQTITDTETSAQ